MRTLDPLCNPIVDPSAPDPSAMPENSSPIHSQNDNSTSDGTNNRENKAQKEDTKEKTGKNSNSVAKGKDNSSVVVRRERPSRACTQRASARLQAAAEAEAEIAEAERKRKKVRREKAAARALSKEESEEDGSFGMEDATVNGDENGEEGGSPSSSRLQCGKIITQLVGEVELSQLPRWNIRNMWQLASIFNFLNVFRPLLYIKVEFSAEEFETALLNPSSILGDVHMPLLKAIPPVTRMALGHNTWVTVLCRKLRDWWHWVAEGDLPIVASHGTEIEAYNALDPSVRVVILKALCDIRVEQEDIRNYIDDSMKHGVHLSAFRRERIGGDSHGISYWYEDDPIIGHRLYREIRKVAIKRGKGRTVPQIPHSSYQWEVVATNLDEFVDVSEKLFSSKNRIEIAVGKKLKNDMLPEIEKVHKKKEKMLKKQHRQALMLDNMMIVDGLVAGRSLRDRKPVTYTFDDFDRSINEAIKVTKRKQSSPELSEKRDPHIQIEGTTNGSRWDGEPSHYPRRDSFTAVSPHSLDGDDSCDDQKTEADALGRSNRRRQKPQRYSVDDFVSADDSDNEPPDSDSDDDIVGEVVYDDEYLRSRKKRRKTTSTSDSEDEYRFDEETHEDEYKAEEDEDGEEDDGSSNSRDGSESDSPHKFKPGRARAHRERHSRSVDELHSGLRRSKRSNRNRINYRQYEMSDSENEKPDKTGGLAATDENFDESDDDSEENSDGESDGEGMHENGPPVEENKGNLGKKNTREEEELSTSRDEEEEEEGGGGKRRFLDLNELAPGSGLDEGPTSTRGDEDDDEEEG